MAKERANQNTNYLQVNKDGLLYIASKTPKEGYKEVELKDGRKTYHKTFTATEDGLIDYIGITEKEFTTGVKTKVFAIVIKGKEESDMVQFRLHTEKGNLNGYVKSLASVLPNVDFSRELYIAPSTKRNDRGYVNPSLFINYVGTEKEFVQFAHKAGKDGDIPAAKEVVKMGQKTYDFTEQDEYLYNILLKEIERFKAFKGTSTPEPKKTEPVENPIENNPLEEDDDLPF